MKKFFLLSLLLFCNALAFAQYTKAAKGYLCIIGGGQRPDKLIADMLGTVQWAKNDYMLVLSMASEVPEQGFEAIAKQLNRLVDMPVAELNFNRQDPHDKHLVDSVARAKLIYILGGSQSRFMASIKDTPVYSAIHRAFENGATVAGTSAGAAVMSRLMITGQQLRDTTYKETFDKLIDKNIAFDQGLGLLGETIIDQHFVKRSRYNRLIAALAYKPDALCIGIDESTAILVHGHAAKVIGDGQVVYLADPKELKITTSGLIKFNSVDFRIYTAGDTFLVR